MACQRKLALAGVAIALAVVGCGATQQAIDPDLSTTHVPATSSTIIPIDSSELVEETHSNSEQLPEWLAAVPGDFEIDDFQPGALAFTDTYKGPGLNYQFSPGLDWAIRQTTGFDFAPLTIWSAGDAVVRTGSTPVPDTSLQDFVGQVSDQAIFLDETHAFILTDRPEGTTYELYVLEIDRLAFLSASFQGQPESEELLPVLQAMRSFQRTPIGENDLGTPSDFEIEYWLAQFDNESNEPSDALVDFGDPLETSTCVAAGLASERLTRYGAVDTTHHDSTDDAEVFRIGNYLADLEEVLAYCGLPPDTFGTRTG